MEVLGAIPFRLEAGALLRQARADADSDEARCLLKLLDTARRVGHPKAAYAEAFVELRDGDAVQIGGRPFASRALSRNLETAGRVFPFVATCGRELDEAVPAPDDPFLAFWRDWLKTCLLDAARRALQDHLVRTFRLGRTASMAPGSGDASVWPIEQQRGLFALLGDVQGAIGVTLTDSFLMVPNKTVSGILFPSETDFRSCEVCRRARCPLRRAPFQEALWAAVAGSQPGAAPTGRCHSGEA